MSGKKDMKNLLPNTGCIKCGKEFDNESIKVVRQEDGLMVLKVKCHSCGKCFGMAYLGLDVNEIEDSLGNLENEMGPINYDDVLDAHRYFKNAEENWSKFVKGKNID